MASTRLPGKPLADINGRPMIVHVLDRAREAAIGPVAVACGEPEIADAVRAAGGTAVLTDPTLPSGSDRVHAALAELDPEGPRRGGEPAGRSADPPPVQLRAVFRPLADPGSTSARWSRRSSDEGGATAFGGQGRLRLRSAAARCRAGPVFLAGADPVGRRAALAPHRHLRLAPRGTGAFRHVAGAPLERRERLDSSRPGGGHAHRLRARRHAPFGVDTRPTWKRARATCAPRGRSHDQRDRLPGHARRIFRSRCRTGFPD